MEKLKFRREPLRRQFLRHEGELENLFKATPLDLETIKITYRLLSDTFTSISDLDQKVFDQLITDEASGEDQDAELGEVSNFKKKAELYRAKLERLILQPPQGSTDNLGSGSVFGETSRRMNLPKIKLQSFNGELINWLGFWSQFKKVDEDPYSDKVEKFMYLTQHLEPGSEPSELAAGYHPSEENYVELVNALKRGYGNEDILLQVYLREILKLVVANVSGEDKLPLKTLWLKLDSHIRALKCLNLQNADPASWLFPLVESSLPQEVQETWHHSTFANHDGSQEDPPRNRLEILMSFMEKEVQIRQRIEITKSFTTTRKETSKFKIENRKANEKTSSKRPVSTMSGYHVGDMKPCIFCNKTNHESKDCFRARKMTVQSIKDILRRQGRCFKCFEKHIASNCNTAGLKCNDCGGGHHTIVCNRERMGSSTRQPQKFDMNRGVSAPKKPRTGNSPTRKSTTTVENINSNQVCNTTVALQTLWVKVAHNGKEKMVRAFLDSGSQRSYILKSTAEEMSLESKGSETVSHVVFGGNRTEVVNHNKYDLKIRGLTGGYQITAEVRDHDRICGKVPRLSANNEEVVRELLQMNITQVDIGEGCPTVELLLGADVYGKILEGKKKTLSCGAVALKTKLGWTLVGEILDAVQTNNLATLTITTAVTESDISKLWELDLIGIKEPVLDTTKRDMEEIVKQRFLDSLTREPNGRYIAKLPWREALPYLPLNKGEARKRLETCTRKLIKLKLFDAYHQIIKDWKEEGIVEMINELPENGRGHYLPHRAVVKPESLTTPVRPVYDASSKTGKNPSLNDCLHKGVNLMQLIPEVIPRFREKPVAFVADIRKAFLMIGVNLEDRDFLRFLWWKDSSMNEVVEYRHARVVFGVTSSPFILAAVLEHHLTNTNDDLKEIGLKLLTSMYVDNCANSENTEELYRKFRHHSTALLKQAGMELRLWFSNLEDFDDPKTNVLPVLGLLWDRRTDEIYLETSKLKTPETFTKRTVLSTIQRVFDPIGFVCPSILPMKILLQKAWINKMKWDDNLPLDEMKSFQNWCNDISLLGQLRFPRQFLRGESKRERWSLHTFTDSCDRGFGAAVFLRVEGPEGTTAHLLAAKARVAPVEGATINRLELLGCLIGARLAHSVKKALGLEDVEEFYWSDSATALAWIQWNRRWGTFIGRRVEEIIRLTKAEFWRHVPGEYNPADLLSRGCTIAQLAASKWWEGPEWLRQPPEAWPTSIRIVDEEAIAKEEKRGRLEVCVISSISWSMASSTRKEKNEDVFNIGEHVRGQHSFKTLVRITGWIRRFIHNFCSKWNKNKTVEKVVGELSPQEVLMAERALVRSIQQECFDVEFIKTLKAFDVMKDEHGVLRVKTKLTYLKDDFNFKFPMLLPGRHPIVKQLISDTHKYFIHAGAGFVVNFLRRKYWVLNARQSVRKVITRCLKCRRYTASKTVTEIIGLPEDRVKSADPFEVTGIDLAGPFVLKNMKKVWMILYTCAVYRAVHLELIDSLSTRTFIRLLEKFTKMFRRPDIIYCDNGTNFHGANNLFKKIDWALVEKDEGVTQIKFKFNPSTASWWGGWWERLIRSAKDLMRRNLGNRCVNRKELERVVSSVAEVMNGRPLTYQSEDPNDLETLTPNHFIHLLGGVQFPESELIDADKLRFRWKYIQKLQVELKQRWKREYLGMLVSRPVTATRPLRVGELVVVSNDKQKRNDWMLARILKLHAGKDGVCRVATIKTNEGVYDRPVQRLHPLELDFPERNDIDEAVVTRSGRSVRKPNRFQ